MGLADAMDAIQGLESRVQGHRSVQGQSEKRRGKEGGGERRVRREKGGGGERRVRREKGGEREGGGRRGKKGVDEEGGSVVFTDDERSTQ